MRLRSRKVVVGLGLLLAAAALLYGFYRFRIWQSGNELASVIAELDRTGEPWRLADLQARCKDIPAEQNGAAIIRKARFGGLGKAYVDFWGLELPPNQVLPPHVIIKLKECLELHEENVREARRLRDFREGRFYYTIAPDVISTLIPHVQDVREVGALLDHDIHWQIQQGDFEQAAQSLQAILMASRTLRDEQFIISHMVRLVLVRFVTDSTERMLAQGQPPVKFLPPLQKLLLEEADFDGFTVAIKGERAGMHQLFEHIEARKVDMRMVRGLMGARTAWHDAVTDRLYNLNVQQEHAWLLRHYTDMLESRKLPPQERVAKFEESERMLRESPGLGKMLSSPVWKNCLPVFLRREVKLRCAVAGLAAEQFRQQHQRWPKTIDELVPEYLHKIQLDPTTDEPLKLRATPDGIVIYSLGPDGDFTGEARDRKSEAHQDVRVDHEFRLWNVDQRRRLAVAPP